ncbi:MAG TPA: glycosyltransferase, partial [Acidobacteriota bacterium]|nr:glycosyltransferase [Acidobacteriota bacterium]
VNLYTNALYVLFTFNHEPFGYIPVESMACGTPVLTYNKQGPTESVVNGSTGWLVNDDEDLLDIALKIWKHGYPQKIRQNCIARSELFDSKKISDELIDVCSKWQ